MWILFFITAALYASVGLAGGSTYLAILYLAHYPLDQIPQFALLLNVAVSLGSVIHYSIARVLKFTQLWPLVVFSIPMSFLGGNLPVSRTFFLALMGLCLFFAGLRLLLPRQKIEPMLTERRTAPLKLAFIGGGIGFISGLVGIGGGIFLGPVLFFIRWNESRIVSAACSFFILVNSLSGLCGQFVKSGIQIHSHWVFGLVAVMLGGQLGNMLTLRVFSSAKIKQITGVLVLAVSLKVFFDLGRGLF